MFVIDHYTELYIQFIGKIQEAMIESLDFVEEACNHMAWFKEMVGDLEISPPLVQMYTDATINSLVKEWEEVCEGKSHCNNITVFSHDWMQKLFIHHCVCTNSVILSIS